MNLHFTFTTEHKFMFIVCFVHFYLCLILVWSLRITYYSVVVNIPNFIYLWSPSLSSWECKEGKSQQIYFSYKLCPGKVWLNHRLCTHGCKVWVKKSNAWSKEGIVANKKETWINKNHTGNITLFPKSISIQGNNTRKASSYPADQENKLYWS